MTQILGINHQLLSDAISVLYSSDFTFHSPTRFSEGNVNTWLRTIGGKKKLVKRISVCIEASMHLLARRGHICDQQGRKLGCLLLKEELVNLTSVEISVMLFPSEVVREQMSGYTLKGGENEKGIFADMIMELMGIFPGLATLVVDKFHEEMKDVVEACSQRFGSPIPVRFSSSMGTERLLRLEFLAQIIQLLRLAEQGELDIEENGRTNSTALRLWRKILTFVSWQPRRNKLNSHILQFSFAFPY
jgi:hypothetical protein